MSNTPNPYGVPSPTPQAFNPYAPTVQVAPEAFGVNDVEQYRKTYLGHEASVKSLGLLYLLGAVFLVPIGAFLFLAAASGNFQPNEPRGVMIGIGLVYFALGLFQGFIGWGLRRLTPWTRIAASVLSAFGLLAVPIGTIISAYFLWVLLGEKGKIVFSDHYRSVIEQTPHIKYKTSIIVWIFLGLLIALIVFVIAMLAS